MIEQFQKRSLANFNISLRIIRHLFLVMLLVQSGSLGCAVFRLPQSKPLKEIEIKQVNFKIGDFVWISYYDSEGQLQMIEGYIKSIDSKGMTLNVFAGKHIKFATISEIKLIKSPQDPKYLFISGGLSIDETNLHIFGAGVRQYGKYVSYGLSFERYSEKGKPSWILSSVMNMHPFKRHRISPYALLGGGLGVIWGGIIPYYAFGTGIQILPSKFYTIRFEVRREGFNVRNAPFAFSFTVYRVLIDLAY